MDDPGVYLVMIGGLFLLGAAGEIIFSRTQIPDVVWLILAGVLLRATGLVDPSKLDAILPLFSALTLIVVLFDGGRQLVIRDLVKAAPKASAMAILSFTISTLGVAVILQLAALTGLLPESWTFFHSLMVGAMVGGSSSLIIMPSMNLAKVEGKVSNLVGLESALTDALCVVVAVVMMNIIKSGEASAGGTVVELGENFGVALIVGLVAGWVWIPLLRLLSGNPYAYPVTLAALLFLYVIVDRMGGNPAMAVLTFSVIVGNAEAIMKMVGMSIGDKPLRLDDTVVTVHTQAAFIIKSFFFTYIGLMLAPPWSLLFLGVVVGASLLATRIPVVMLIARKPEFSAPERKMITISLPRGMAAGVLATLPASAKYKIAGTEDLPAMVFAAVVTSIAIFAVGFRKARAETAAHAHPPPEPTADAVGAGPDGAPSIPAPAAKAGDELPPGAMPDGHLPADAPADAQAPADSEQAAAAPEPDAAAPGQAPPPDQVASPESAPAAPGQGPAAPTPPGQAPAPPTPQPSAPVGAPRTGTAPGLPAVAADSSPKMPVEPKAPAPSKPQSTIHGIPTPKVDAPEPAGQPDSAPKARPAPKWQPPGDTKD